MSIKQITLLNHLQIIDYNICHSFEEVSCYDIDISNGMPSKNQVIMIRVSYNTTQICIILVKVNRVLSIIVHEMINL